MVFIASQLLFVTLLLQATKESKELREHATPQPDSSMPHREFCLRIPDDSHWTSSEPGTQLPTKSNHPNEQPTEPTNQGSSPLNLTPQLPKQTAQLDGGPVLPPKETTQPEYDNPVGMMAPYPPPVQSGCLCKNKDMKLPTETSKVIRRAKMYPSKTCSSSEYIEYLADDTHVCVTPVGFMPSFDDIFLWLKVGANPFTGPKGSTVGPQNPTTVLPTSTQLMPTELALAEALDVHTPDSILGEGLCKTCDLLTINLDDVDPKAVESLDVNFQSHSCTPLIYINQKDKRMFCSNLSLDIVLQKLEILLHQEDNAGIVDGCRCREREKMLPTITSRVTKKTIWPPSEKCSYTEVTETLEGGREVCTTPFSPPAVSLIPVPNYDEIIATLERSLIEPGYRLLNNVLSGTAPRADSLLQPPASCDCRFPTSWNNIETKDVESLNVELSPGCVAFIYVTLKDKTKFCVDVRFKDLLLQLHMQAE